MSTRRIIACRLGLLLVCFAVTCAAQEKPRRDLKTYGYGGSYELTWAASGPEGLEKIKESVRTFIWGHWEHRQAGYITIRDCTENFEGCDGSTFYTFYIEPDSAGGWRVAEETRHYVSAELNGGKESFGPTDSVIFSNVEKIRSIDPEECLSFFSSSLAVTESHTFLLRFIYDKSKKKDLSRNCIIF